jgi:16S rRNA (guanine527-N7)-methyltransferase
MGELNAALDDGLNALRLSLPESAKQRLLAYLALLVKWNRVYSLTAITEPEKMLSHHLFDSLAVIATLDALNPSQILDVGSGGGQPGLIFAIARPNWHLTVLDSNSKKAAFLRQAQIELALTNVMVVAERVENYIPANRYDLVVSRAFAELTDFISGSRHLLSPNGHWAALKGVEPIAEIAAFTKELSRVQVINVAVPGLAAQRCVVLVRQAESDQARLIA